MSLMLKPSLYFLLLLISCIPKTEKPIEEVSVEVTSSILEGSSRVETNYELKEGDCRILWQVSSEKKNEKLEAYLMNRSECELPFSQAEKIYGKVFARILKDYSPESIKTIATNGLKSIQPDGSWNFAVAKAAEESAEYLEYRKNYPNHKSQGAPNSTLVDLINQTNVHAPFLQMLEKFNLHFELTGVEKVFNAKNEKGETVINDAGVLWWERRN